MLALLLAGALAADPVYVVENKTKPYTVVNKCTTGPAPVGMVWVQYPGQPWKLEARTAAQAAPVPQAPSVQLQQRDPDHRCDRCGHESARGTGTWVIRGYNADGTHNHSCPNCGHSWRH